MPIYEYVCDECGHRFDRLQTFRDDPVKVCPECGKATCRRLISAPGIVFKGSGWYIKDSKTRGTGAGLGAAARAEGGEGGEGNGGSSDGASSKGDGGSSDGASTAAPKSDGASSSGTSGDKASGSSSGSGSDKASGSSKKADA